MSDREKTIEQRRLAERRDVPLQVLLTPAEFQRLIAYAGRGNVARLIRSRIADVICAGADGAGDEG